jgi:hypothetical protein
MVYPRVLAEAAGPVLVHVVKTVDVHARLRFDEAPHIRSLDS